MTNHDTDTITFDKFISLCPYTHEKMFSGHDEDLIQQFLIDLKFLHKEIKEGRIDKDELFILTSNDFTISIKKFLQNYNRTTGLQFPLTFLFNYMLECGVPSYHIYTFIIAPRTHINYFKLVNDVKEIAIHSLDESLKESLPNLEFSSEMNKYEWLLETIKEFEEKKSIRLMETIIY